VTQYRERINEVLFSSASGAEMVEKLDALLQQVAEESAPKWSQNDTYQRGQIDALVTAKELIGDDAAKLRRSGMEYKTKGHIRAVMFNDEL
jgi:hypothetical protein